MVVAVIAFLATAAASLMSYALLGNTSGKTDFGQEVLTNSRIEHEENKSITSSFFFRLQKWRPCITHYSNMWNIAIPTITWMWSVLLWLFLFRL